MWSTLAHRASGWGEGRITTHSRCWQNLWRKTNTNETLFCNKRLCHHARKDFSAINGDLPDDHVVFKRETESMANDFHAPVDLLKSKSAEWLKFDLFQDLLSLERGRFCLGWVEHSQVGGHVAHHACHNLFIGNVWKALATNSAHHLFPIFCRKFGKNRLCGQPETLEIQVKLLKTSLLPTSCLYTCSWWVRLLQSAYILPLLDS